MRDYDSLWPFRRGDNGRGKTAGPRCSASGESWRSAGERRISAPISREARAIAECSSGDRERILAKWRNVASREISTAGPATGRAATRLVAARPRDRPSTASRRPTVRGRCARLRAGNAIDLYISATNRSSYAIFTLVIHVIAHGRSCTRSHELWISD